MICISIGQYGFDACRKALKRCEKLRKEIPGLMAELRMDLCGLDSNQVYDLIKDAKVPIVATARPSDQHLYKAAALAGVDYMDLNVIAYTKYKKSNRADIQGKHTKLILSFHDYEITPSLDALIKIYRQAVEAGADVVKIISTANSDEDISRILDLYRLQREGKLGRQVPLIAYAMGDDGKYSRLAALLSGAPWMYCALKAKYKVASGMFTVDEYLDLPRMERVSGEAVVPASKSIAQRAIIAAMLSKGTSEFKNYTPCWDNDSAVDVARDFSAIAYVEDDTITVKGGFFNEKKQEEANPFAELAAMSFNTLGGSKTIFIGESGLLSRLCIPIAAQYSEPVTITGEGSILDRHMYGCKEGLEDFGASCLLTEQETLPAVVSGPLKGGDVTVSGKKGSQFISGLLMALPLCKKDSVLRIENPTSVPYIKMTLDVLSKFGINISSRFEKDRAVFTIPGKQKYIAADFTIEGDWSSAANFVVMAAIFGEITVKGLNMQSSQADSKIVDIALRSGAAVEFTSRGLNVRMGHLKAITQDVTDCPDLLPILVIMAVFSEGTSVFKGVARLKNKESNRPQAMLESLKKMGVSARLEDDTLEVDGICLARRVMEGKMLRGGSFLTHSDHRIAMALKVASLGCEGKMTYDTLDCIGKSFPDFLKIFEEVKKIK